MHRVDDSHERHPSHLVHDNCVCETHSAPLFVPHPGHAFGGCFIPTPDRLANVTDVRSANGMIRDDSPSFILAAELFWSCWLALLKSAKRSDTGAVHSINSKQENGRSCNQEEDIGGGDRALDLERVKLTS